MHADHRTIRTALALALTALGALMAASPLSPALT
jgi:hypothetical protein